MDTLKFRISSAYGCLEIALHFESRVRGRREHVGCGLVCPIIDQNPAVHLSRVGAIRLCVKISHRPQSMCLAAVTLSCLSYKYEEYSAHALSAAPTDEPPEQARRVTFVWNNP
jgi:hypothetical protein